MTLSKSADTYHGKIMHHAIAEGMYMSAISVLRQCEVITKQSFEQRMQQSIERCKQSALCSSATEIAWGLGFPYKETSATEPFLITTAVVLQGACDAAGAGFQDEELSSLATRASAWLTSRERSLKLGKSGLVAPRYSSCNTDIVYNAVTKWAAAIDDARHCFGIPRELDADPVFDWIRDTFDTDLGWSYSDRSNIYDLVHQSFIINDLLTKVEVEELERCALTAISNHFRGDVYMDRYVEFDMDVAIHQVTKFSNFSLASFGERAVVFDNRLARRWSVGSTLETLSRLALVGKYKDYWESMIRRFPECQLCLPRDRTKENTFFRQDMYLANGAARALFALKSLSLPG